VFKPSWPGSETSREPDPPVLFQRPVVELFPKLTVGTDPIHGPLIDNTSVGRVLVELLSPLSSNINRNKTLN
jgi:hypothetical protein